MINELVRELLQATLAGSAAIVLLASLRRPLRARFGAQLAYGAWLLVPIAMLAVLLPAGRKPEGLALAGNSSSFAIGAMGGNASVLPELSIGAAGLVALAWGLGVACFTIGFAVWQRRFGRQIERRPGRAFDTVSGHGPALVGLWRSRIVLPDDFRERYTRAEQRLVVAHEISHLRRGDIHAQAFVTGLRCLFWFNPLFHYAAGLFRFDQELACDASVVERFPGARGRYGSAMLKTQLAGFGLPVGCHWQSSHPLKERIEMLKQPLPARTRKLSGSLLVAMLMACGSYAAWAAQPKAPAASHAAAPAPWITRVTAKDHMPPPRYPAEAEAKKIKGKVEIELLVGIDGKVKDVQVISSTPAGVFDQAAIDAARGWIIPSLLEQGALAEKRVRTLIEFSPDGDPSNPAPSSAKPKQG